MDGYSDRAKPAEGIHDRLSCRALFLEDDKTSLALISCDVCWFSEETIVRIKNELEKKTVDHVMVFATHNHSGPAMTDLLAPLNEVGLRYLEGLPQIICE